MQACFVKGSFPLPKRMNFRKSSKRGGGSFSIQKFILQIFAIIDDTSVMNFRKKLQHNFPKIHPFWKGNASLKGGYLTRDFCISPKRALDMWYIFVSVRTDTFENIVTVAGKIASVGFQIYFPAHHICQ